MAEYALIVRGKVHELRDFAADPSTLAHKAMQWVAVPAGLAVAQGWTYADGKLAAPVVDQAAVAATQAARVRAHRNKLLAASDWSQMPDATQGDVPLTEAAKVAWADYRKALKVLPKEPGFPQDVTWPTPPASNT